MRVAYAIPVRYIEAMHDGTFMMTGVESNLKSVAEFPADIMVPMFVVLAAPPAEQGTIQTLRARVLDPELRDAADPLAVQIPFPTAPALLPAGWEVRMSAPLAVRVHADGPGAYSVEFATDTSTCDIPFIVVGPS